MTRSIREIARDVAIDLARDEHDRRADARAQPFCASTVEENLVDAVERVALQLEIANAHADYQNQLLWELWQK
jgi:hypothetical protein